MPDIDTRQAAALLAVENDIRSPRSETARLAELIDHIEAAFARGISRKDVLARLHESGFTMSLHTFDKALYRIRRRTGRTHGRNAPVGLRSTSSIPTPSASLSEPIETETLPDGRHVKTTQQLRRENPTMPGIQINKLWAQQYASPIITSEELEELKRKYGSSQIKG